MNDEPYWSITAIENVSNSKAGGAQQLSAYLVRLTHNLETEFDKSKMVIGIFDNDQKGYQEFNGLPEVFESTNGILKKVKEMNIFALLLPLPEEESYEVYHQEKQAFKFFEIEHYFPLELLEKNNMVTETSIPKLYEITGSKSDFNNKILKIGNKENFQGFIELFKELDRLCSKSINYLE